MDQSRREFLKTVAAASGAVYLSTLVPSFAFADDPPALPANNSPEILMGENGADRIPNEQQIVIETLPEENPWPHGGDNSPSLEIFDVSEDDPNYREYQRMKEHFSQDSTGENTSSEGGLVPYSTNTLDPIPHDGAILRLAIVSDTHSGYWGDLAIAKLNNALAIYKEIAPDIDAAFVIGDLVCLNTQDEITAVLDGVIKPLPSLFTDRKPLHLLVGNHDLLGNWNIDAFEMTYGRYLRNYQDPSFATNSTAPLSEDYGQKQNTLIYLNDVPIIKLSPQNATDSYDYRYLYDFLEQTLAEARAHNADSARPILVMAHHPMQGQWFEEADDCGNFGVGTSRDLSALLSQYPEVVFLSGHVHNPLQMPQSINQDLGFTIIHTATCGAALWLKNGIIDHDRSLSQGILLDIFADNKIRVTRIEFGLQTYLGTTWEFYPTQSADSDAPFLIAPRRALAAAFPNTSFANLIVSPQSGALTVRFKQGTKFSASENAFIYRYQLHITNQTTHLPIAHPYQYSDFLNQDMADEFLFPYGRGISNDTWKIEVVALNTYDDVMGTLSETVTPTNSYLGWIDFPEGRRYYPTPGNAAHGWQKISGFWYYFDESSALMLTGWIWVGGGWFYLTPSSGQMLTGWQKLPWSGGVSWFYFRGGDSGRMLEGWQKINGSWYYLVPGDGNMLTGWQRIDGSWFYFLGGDNGRMVTGWQKLPWSGGVSWFYFRGGDSGRMLEGWQKIDGSWYYLVPWDGNMLTGWQKIGGDWYYFRDGDSGRMLTGWQYLNWFGKEDWYYFLGGDNGRMVTGTHTIGGTRYTFDSGGALVG